MSTICGWTALIESIVLGNGGKNHTDTLARAGRSRRQCEYPGPQRLDAAHARERPRLQGDDGDFGEGRREIAHPEISPKSQPKNGTFTSSKKPLAIKSAPRMPSAPPIATSQPISAMIETEISTIAICSSACA